VCLQVSAILRLITKLDFLYNEQKGKIDTFHAFYTKNKFFGGSTPQIFFSFAI